MRYTCPHCQFDMHGDRPTLGLCPNCNYLGEFVPEAQGPDLSALPMRSRVVLAMLPKGWVLRRLEAIEKLGITLFECLTGAVPVDRRVPERKARQVAPPPRPPAKRG